VKLGDLLAEMADLHKVRVRAFIDEPELGALEENEPVKITWDALPEQDVGGENGDHPEAGGAAPEPQRRGELTLRVNNDKLELRPNINVTVRINSRERIGVLSVTAGRRRRGGRKRYVFVGERNQLSVNKSILEKRRDYVA